MPLPFVDWCEILFTEFTQPMYTAYVHVGGLETPLEVLDQAGY